MTQSRDGTLLVWAKNVEGTLRFGYTEDRVVTATDGVDCIVDGRAKKCVLGEEGTDARTTLPPYCVLHLEDAADTCIAQVKKCVPAMRAACPPDMERLGARCIERTANAGEEWADAARVCHERGRSLCTVSELMVCDGINRTANVSGSCRSRTDSGGSSLWTSTSNAEDGQNVYGRPVRYGSNNVIGEQATGTGGIYDFFCCGPLGTP